MRASFDHDEEDMNYGFRMALGRGYMAVDIGQSLQREPLDQTNLRNDGDAT
jgi:hypothetical protein